MQEQQVPQQKQTGHDERNHMVLLAISVILLVTLVAALGFSVNANSQLEKELSANQLELANIHNQLRMAEQLYDFDVRDLEDTQSEIGPSLIVFFDPEVSDSVIFGLRDNWEDLDSIADIDYLSSEDAKADYINQTAPDDYVRYQLVADDSVALPSSLEIFPAEGVDFLSLQDQVTSDVNEAIRQLDSTELQIQVRAKNI